MNLFTLNIKGVDIKMVPVEGGTFWMGANTNDSDAWENEYPRHPVTLSDYYISPTMVTWALWNTVMDQEANPNANDLPVTGKSWVDCQIFIERLNELTGLRFRMPTEAEWEYAARGGNKSVGYRYAGGNNLDEVAWFDQNSGGRVHAVAEKMPNELGLYDMAGNTFEWCNDWYGPYERGDENDPPVLNPKGAGYGSQRVRRGSGFSYYARSCRVTCRFSVEALGKDYSNTGLRLVMDEPDPGWVPPYAPSAFATPPGTPEPSGFSNPSASPNPSRMGSYAPQPSQNVGPAPLMSSQPRGKAPVVPQDGVNYNKPAVGLVALSVIFTLLTVVGGGLIAMVGDIIILSKVKLNGVKYNKYRKAARVWAVIDLILVPILFVALMLLVVYINDLY